MKFVFCICQIDFFSYYVRSITFYHTYTFLFQTAYTFQHFPRVIFSCASWNACDTDTHMHHEIGTMKWSSHHFEGAPWKLNALTNLTYSSSSHWRMHMCTGTCVWHPICAFTPGSHVHHEMFLQHIHMCTMISAPWWPSSKLCQQWFCLTCVIV